MSPLSLICWLTIGTSVAVAATSDDPLASYRWKSRVIVAIAPSAHDPNADRQRRLYHDMRQGARERDLVLLEAIGSSPQAEALRRRFDIGPAFTALLIGKDGDEKLRSQTPVGANELFPLIDSMPMRQEEMRKGTKSWSLAVLALRKPSAIKIALGPSGALYSVKFDVTLANMAGSYGRREPSPR